MHKKGELSDDFYSEKMGRKKEKETQGVAAKGFIKRPLVAWEGEDVF